MTDLQRVKRSKTMHKGEWPSSTIGNRRLRHRHRFENRVSPFPCEENRSAMTDWRPSPLLVKDMSAKTDSRTSSKSRNGISNNMNLFIHLFSDVHIYIYIYTKRTPADCSRHCAYWPYMYLSAYVDHIDRQIVIQTLSDWPYDRKKELWRHDRVHVDPIQRRANDPLFSYFVLTQLYCNLFPNFFPPRTLS